MLKTKFVLSLRHIIIRCLGTYGGLKSKAESNGVWQSWQPVYVTIFVTEPVDNEWKLILLCAASRRPPKRVAWLQLPAWCRPPDPLLGQHYLQCLLLVRHYLPLPPAYLWTPPLRARHFPAERPIGPVFGHIHKRASSVLNQHLVPNWSSSLMVSR